MTTGSKLLDSYNSNLFGIEMFFIELDSYQELMEGYLSDYHSKLKDLEIDSLGNDFPSNEFANEYSLHLLNSRIKQEWEVLYLYPHTLRSSFLIQTFSVIEYELRKICEYHQLVNDIQLGVSDSRGNNDLEKIKRYLKDNCNIDFNSLNPEWEFINKVRKLRNKLVHHNGIIKSSDQGIKTFLLENSFAKLFDINNKPDEQSIIIDKSLTKAFLSSTQDFFAKLLEKIITTANNV